MRYEPAQTEHFYTNQTHPYFRAPHLYLATAARFVPGRNALSIEEIVALGVPGRYAKVARDTTDPVLLTSRDGETYDQTFRESLVAPSLRPEEWISRSNYPLLNLVQTEPEEMSFYIQHDYGAPSAHVRRYSWPLDRIASVSAGYEGGEFVTRPLVFAGGRLHLNFSTSAVGSIRVEIQDESGTAIPGFALEDNTELIGNRLDRVATWGERDDLSTLAGKAVRLRFVMKSADVYAMRFGE